MKKLLTLLGCFVLCICLSGCGHSLSGIYITEDGEYELLFDKDRKAILYYVSSEWIAASYIYDGWYEYDGNGVYKLIVQDPNNPYYGYFLEVQDDGSLLLNGGLPYTREEWHGLGKKYEYSYIFTGDLNNLYFWEKEDED